MRFVAEGVLGDAGHRIGGHPADEYSTLRRRLAVATRRACGTARRRCGAPVHGEHQRKGDWSERLSGRPSAFTPRSRGPAISGRGSEVAVIVSGVVGLGAGTTPSGQPRPRQDRVGYDHEREEECMGRAVEGRFSSLTPEELLGPLNTVEERYAPPFLFVAGDPALIHAGPRVALVGSRRASAEGLARAGRLARELAQQHVTVVSGLAEGIDTAAHRAALEAGGRTIAVVGTPLDKFYPADNRALQERIANEHLVISQFPFGTPLQRKNFPIRNRTMALVCHASVIIEAGETSGSLSQGWEALRLGRPLFLLQSIVQNSLLRWPAQMLDYGAMVLSDPEDVLQLLPSGEFLRHADVGF